MPSAKSVLIHMWERSRAFIVKAGTIIFVACCAIWFLSSFGFVDGSFGMVDQEVSLLAAIGNAIAPVFAPLGFGNWKAAVATVSGLIAKENVVGTFGVLNGIADAAESDPGLWTATMLMFPSALGAMSFLIFNLLCAPCFAAIGAIKREMASGKWTFFAIGYQTVFAYVIALMVYQLGSVFNGGAFGIGTAAALAVLIVMLYLLFRPAPQRTISMSRARAHV
jgi:ferrous iron transport protein B